MSWSYNFESFDGLLRSGLLKLSSDRAQALEELILASHIYDILPLESFSDCPGTKTEHLIDLLAHYLTRLFASDDIVRPIAADETHRIAGFEVTHIHILEFGYFSLLVHLFFGLYRRTTYRFFLDLALEACEVYRGRLHPIARRIRFWSAMHRSLELALSLDVSFAEPERVLALLEQITARGFLDLYVSLGAPGHSRKDDAPQGYDVATGIGKQVPEDEDNLCYPITQPYNPQPMEDFPLYSRGQLFQFIDECSVFQQDRWDLPQQRTLPVSDIARALPEGWAFMTYRQVDNQLMCAVLGVRGSPEMFRLDTWEALDDVPVLERDFARVLRLLRRLGGAGLPVHQRFLDSLEALVAGESLTEGLQELHRLVFCDPRSGARTPSDALAGMRQVLIVPGFPLQDVPMAAAYDGSSFLIERCSVAFIPSGTWFGLSRARSERPLLTALLLVDPTNDLPGARREGELVADQLRQAGVAVTSLQGSTVTRDWVIEHGMRFDLLHYAGHGSFELNKSSFLSLSDGPLLLADLLTGAWQPRLVVLNACQSGVRKVHLLDETLSMASGFLALGVGAVISTLWPVNDEIALQFAEALYAAFLQGRPIGEAYQMSLVELIRRSVPASKWAPYVLSGDPGIRI